MTDEFTLPDGNPIGELILARSIAKLIDAMITPSAAAAGRHMGEVVDEFLNDLRQRNLKDHMRRAKDRLDSMGATPAPLSSGQLRLIDEWRSGAQDHSADSGKIGELWQELLVRILLGKRDQHALISAMKTLTPEGAELLLRIFESELLFKESTDRDETYLDQLRASGIARSRMLFPPTLGLFLSLLIVGGLMAYSLFRTSGIAVRFDYLNAATMAGLLSILIATQSVLRFRSTPWFRRHFGFRYWELTWIGEALGAAVPNSVSGTRNRPPVDLAGETDTPAGDRGSEP